MNTTAQKIEVMKAELEGKAIEYLNLDNGWSESFNPSWNWASNTYRIKPAQTLKERIEAEYGECRVVMLEWKGNVLFSGPVKHIECQSSKGFYRYVYEEGQRLSVGRDATTFYGSKTIQPVAVLFYKEEV